MRDLDGLNLGDDSRSEDTNSETAKDAIDSEVPTAAVDEPAEAEAEGGPDAAAEIKSEIKTEVSAIDPESDIGQDISDFAKATEKAQKKAKFSTDFHQGENLPQDLYDTLNFTPSEEPPTYSGKFDPNSFIMFQDPSDLPSYYIDTTTATFMPRILGNPTNSLNPEKLMIDSQKRQSKYWSNGKYLHFDIRKYLQSEMNCFNYNSDRRCIQI